MPADEFDSLFGHELEGLREVERGVLEIRFGLLDGLPLTLAKIGARSGRSRARVQQIEQRALRKLRYRKRGDPLYRYVHGRHAATERWNARGVEYLLGELAQGGRRRRLPIEEEPQPTPRRRRSLPADSRRIVEWIAQGFSYRAILASDRRLRSRDIFKAAREIFIVSSMLEKERSREQHWRWKLTKVFHPFHSEGQRHIRIPHDPRFQSKLWILVSRELVHETHDHIRRGVDVIINNKNKIA